MRRCLLAGITLACLAGGSAAADVWEQPPVYQVAVPPVYGVASRPPGLFSWSGFYFGGHVGWGWGAFEIEGPGFPSQTIDLTGFVAGGQAGYNWQWSQIVFGVETDISATQFNGNDGNVGAAVDRFDGRRGWGATVRGRLGYTFDRWLFFVTGGWAFLNYNYSSTILPAGPGVVFSDHDNGWTVGGGIEQAFSPNWSAKVEYLHTDYGNRGRAAAIFANPWTTTLATDEVRIGLNYRFEMAY
jgi:outer membrane immunogenic protein